MTMLEKDRNARAYDSLKTRLLGWAREIMGGHLQKFAEFLLLVPDTLVLVGRVILDRRVPRDLRIKLGIVLTYITSPIDLLPEALIGPLGLLDDLVLIIYALEKTLAEVDRDILEEHWSGRPEQLDTLRELAGLVKGMLGDRIKSGLRGWFGDTGQAAGEGKGRIQLISGAEDGEESLLERSRAAGL
jgi:uncharacterized membrane protein YkvA (DUF1232 family)